MADDPRDLAIRFDPALSVAAPAFGAVADPDGRSLRVPASLGPLLASVGVDTASGMAGLARRFPEAVAGAVGMGDARAAMAAEELAAMLAGHVDPTLLGDIGPAI